MKSEPSDGGECRGFRNSVYPYLDNELNEKDRNRLQQHLDDCPDCGRYLEFEDRFSNALRARLPQLGAPEGLLERVNSVLDREGTSVRRRSRLGAYVGAAGFAVAAVSLLSLGVPGRWLGRSANPAGEAVEREVTVVDEECDRAGVPVERQRDCKRPDHLNALRLEDGSYWNLTLDGPEARRLAGEPLVRGHRIRVEGELYAPIRTIHVTHVRDLAR